MTTVHVMQLQEKVVVIILKVAIAAVITCNHNNNGQCKDLKPAIDIAICSTTSRNLRDNYMNQQLIIHVMQHKKQVV